MLPSKELYAFGPFMKFDFGLRRLFFPCQGGPFQEQRMTNFLFLASDRSQFFTTGSFNFCSSTSLSYFTSSENTPHLEIYSYHFILPPLFFYLIPRTPVELNQGHENGHNPRSFWSFLITFSPY